MINTSTNNPTRDFCPASDVAVWDPISEHTQAWSSSNARRFKGAERSPEMSSASERTRVQLFRMGNLQVPLQAVITYFFAALVGFMVVMGFQAAAPMEAPVQGPYSSVLFDSQPAQLPSHP